MFNFLKSLFGGSQDMETIKQLIASGSAVIIDVRTPGEFAGGNPKGSKNFPLDKLESNIDKLKGFQKPLIVCCASGVRSARAAGLLKSKGITEVYDAGGWHNIA